MLVGYWTYNCEPGSYCGLVAARHFPLLWVTLRLSDSIWLVPGEETA